eukprot:scaffold263_cov251-Pinguiococcus_pyrenoidosus.AAC.8
MDRTMEVNRTAGAIVISTSSAPRPPADPSPEVPGPPLLSIFDAGTTSPSTSLLSIDKSTPAHILSGAEGVV